MVTDSNDNVWIAYGDSEQESGLGRYNPMNGEWESLFCSIIQGEPPFSNGSPYMINSMILKSRKRLIFNVFENNFKENGLWKLNTDTFETECIWSGYGTIFKDINDAIWLNSTSYKMKFNPDSEKITMIIGPGRHQLYANNIKAISGLDKDIFLPESFVNKIKFGPYYVQGNLDLSTGAIKNNKLWARLGENQIIIAEQGKSFEEVTIIENNILNGKPVLEFVSSPNGLIAIGEGIVGLIQTENIEK